MLGELLQTTAGKWITHRRDAPNGHTLGPGEVLVGHQACHGHGGGHTTWTCRTCDQTVYEPPPWKLDKFADSWRQPDYRPPGELTKRGPELVRFVLVVAATIGALGLGSAPTAYAASTARVVGIAPDEVATASAARAGYRRDQAANQYDELPRASTRQHSGENPDTR